MAKKKAGKGKKKTKDLSVRKGGSVKGGLRSIAARA
jgi:hypothetical protein